MKWLSRLALLALALSGNLADAYGVEGKFSRDQKIIVFIGQDNASVGGNEQWQSGYVNQVGLPAGITHYVYFSEDKTNPYGFHFKPDVVDGLNEETTWGAGPMCLRCYLESPLLEETVIHLSISMEFDDEIAVAKGESNHLIEQLADVLAEYPHREFLLRIGYEFEGSWNHYEPEAFKQAWRNIVDRLRARELTNFATVLGSSRFYIDRDTWDAYWPGDNYVDWLGYSYWHNETKEPVVFDLAREKQLPVLVAEVTPRGFWLNMTDPELIWNDWFVPFFEHVESHKDVIRGISYINSHWDGVPMWRGWGDSRIQLSDKLRQKWLEKMAEPLYLHGKSNNQEEE